MTCRNVCLCAFALTSMLTFAGCQTAPTPEPKRDVAADTAAINALRDQYIAAVNSGDAAAVAATFDDDAVEMPPNQVAGVGKQAIQARLDAMFKEATFKGVPSTVLETQVAGDWAYRRTSSAQTVTPKSGKPMEQLWKGLSIFKRQPDGSWRYYRLISISNNPPPAAVGKKK